MTTSSFSASAVVPPKSERMASSAPWPGVKYSCFLRLICMLVLFGEGCEQGCKPSALESEEVTDLLTK